MNKLTLKWIYCIHAERLVWINEIWNDMEQTCDWRRPMTIKTHMELMTHDDNHIFVNPLYPATYKIHCTKHIVYCTLNLFLDLSFYMLIYWLYCKFSPFFKDCIEPCLLILYNKSGYAYLLKKWVLGDRRTPAISLPRSELLSLQWFADEEICQRQCTKRREKNQNGRLLCVILAWLNYSRAHQVCLYDTLIMTDMVHIVQKSYNKYMQNLSSERQLIVACGGFLSD